MACRSAFNIDIFFARYNAPHCYSSWVVGRLMNGKSGPYNIGVQSHVNILWSKKAIVVIALAKPKNTTTTLE